jgi:hypothetical protein
MNSRAKKVLLLGLAAVLLTANGFLQRLMNREREALGITRIAPLENAPPVLALTTQVLGGFRGLIANALWLRATEMQEKGQYFEMVQLADWITKLEPHIVTVWQVQAWNMAFNISVKFPDHADRWRWVQRGIELLRDEALRYNPDQPGIYAELAWFFQFKMGQNLDDAHYFYKGSWANEMMALFGGEKPDFDRLLAPQTPIEQERAARLSAKYKMSAAKMREVNERYGPLDWRLPEAHAIYWASVGLDKSDTEEDVRRLRTAIYQGLNLSFQRGRLLLAPNRPPRMLPNLELAPKLDAAFQEQLTNSPAHLTNGITRAYRNFLRDVPYQFFLVARLRDAEQWLNYLRQKFPEAVPPGATLAEYAVARAELQTKEQRQNYVAGLVNSFVIHAYMAAIASQPDEFQQFLNLARQTHAAYLKTTKANDRLGILSVEETEREVTREMLGPNSPLGPEEQARLRTFLGVPLENPAPPEKKQ